MTTANGASNETTLLGNGSGDLPLRRGRLCALVHNDMLPTVMAGRRHAMHDDMLLRPLCSGARRGRQRNSSIGTRSYCGGKNADGRWPLREHERRSARLQKWGRVFCCLADSHQRQCAKFLCELPLQRPIAVEFSREAKYCSAIGVCVNGGLRPITTTLHNEIVACVAKMRLTNLHPQFTRMRWLNRIPSMCTRSCPSSSSSCGARASQRRPSATEPREIPSWSSDYASAATCTAIRSAA